MARDGAIYVCQSCGAAHAEMVGPVRGVRRLEQPGRGGPRAARPARWRRRAAPRRAAWPSRRWRAQTPRRRPGIATGVEEFDRVCGGGVVPGSAILLAGDPGVGKSTLLLQVCARRPLRGAACAYISGEEAIEQIRARAGRMGLAAGSGASWRPKPRCATSSTG